MSIETRQTLGKTNGKAVLVKNARPVNTIGWANTLFSQISCFEQVT